MTLSRTRYTDEELYERVAWSAPAWLTIEWACYALLAVGALAVRLAALGLWPLTEQEALTALSAWRASQGSSWRAAQYTPLIFNANLLVFWLARASDAGARLLPTLAGALLTLLPYHARDILGRRGALAAAALLAFAPSWVFFSRTAEGPILTAAASALLMLSLWRYTQSANPKALRLAAVALGLGLTAGPGLYTTLLAIALLLAWGWRQARRRGDVERWGALLRGAFARENLALAVGTFVFFASGFLFNLGGIGASVELAGQWTRALLPGQSGLPWSSFLRILTTYELLTVALALVGVVVWVRQRDPLGAWLLVWTGVALALSLPLGHREPLWVLDTLLPLTLLAARGVEFLWEKLGSGLSTTDGVILALALPVLAFGYLQLAAYVHTGREAFFTYARLAVGLLIIALAAYALWVQREPALRAAIALTLVVLGMITLRATTALAYQTGRNPREALVGTTVSPQLREFEELIRTTSSRQIGDPYLLDAQYEQALFPWLDWYLRDYPRAVSAPSVGAQARATVAVTSSRTPDEWLSGYIGQSFRLREHWPAQTLSFRSRLRWFLYRDSIGSVQADLVQVWLLVASGK